MKSNPENLKKLTMALQQKKDSIKAIEFVYGPVEKLAISYTQFYNK